MELFRQAAVLKARPGDHDWTRDHGLSQTSEFPFPDIYLHERVTSLAALDSALLPFLEECLYRFVNHDYGNLISLDQVENFISRDYRQANTWMQAIYPTKAWGNVHLEVFFDLALFHLEDVAPRALAMAQRDREKASR